jgi:hypothetical protein
MLTRIHTSCGAELRSWRVLTRLNIPVEKWRSYADLWQHGDFFEARSLALDGGQRRARVGRHFDISQTFASRAYMAVSLRTAP